MKFYGLSLSIAATSKTPHLIHLMRRSEHNAAGINLRSKNSFSWRATAALAENTDGLSSRSVRRVRKSPADRNGGLSRAQRPRACLSNEAEERKGVCRQRSSRRTKMLVLYDGCWNISGQSRPHRLSLTGPDSGA